MYFHYFEITFPWKRVRPFIWTNLNPHHPRSHFAKFCWNWPGGSREDDFWISLMYYRYLLIISLWKQGGALHLINLESPSPKEFDWNWPSGSGDKDFWISTMYFRYFVIIFPCKRAGPCIWWILNVTYIVIIQARIRYIISLVFSVDFSAASFAFTSYMWS